MPQVSAMSESVGRRVAAARSRLGLTQQGLARLLRATGVRWTTATVAKVETGRREVSVGEAVALGMALGLTPSEILTPDGPVRLGRTGEWVWADAVQTWAEGNRPSDAQRARWAADEVPGAAPLRWLSDSARLLAAFLSHVPQETWTARVRQSQVAGTREAVTAALDVWLQEQEAAGRPVTPHARRAKESLLWREQVPRPR